MIGTTTGLKQEPGGRMSACLRRLSVGVMDIRFSQPLNDSLHLGPSGGDPFNPFGCQVGDFRGVFEVRQGPMAISRGKRRWREFGQPPEIGEQRAEMNDRLWRYMIAVHSQHAFLRHCEEIGSIDPVDV